MHNPRINWNYSTEPEPRLDGRRLYWPRGKVLGGCSSINAMCYVRGHPQDYDDWARAGNPGWSYEEVLPCFRESERQQRGASRYHGANGPLAVEDLRDRNVLSDVFVSAGMQVGLPRNDDFNAESQEGVGYYQVTQRGGRRCSTSVAYLDPARPRDNLTIETSSFALRVVLERGKAGAVEYARGGQRRVAHCEGFDLDAYSNEMF